MTEQNKEKTFDEMNTDEKTLLLANTVDKMSEEIEALNNSFTELIDKVNRLTHIVKNHRHDDLGNIYVDTKIKEL